MNVGQIQKRIAYHQQFRGLSMPLNNDECQLFPYHIHITVTVSSRFRPAIHHGGIQAPTCNLFPLTFALAKMLYQLNSVNYSYPLDPSKSQIISCD